MNRRIMKKVLRDFYTGAGCARADILRAAYIRFWRREYHRIWRLQYETKVWPVTRAGRWCPLMFGQTDATIRGRR